MVQDIAKKKLNSLSAWSTATASLKLVGCEFKRLVFFCIFPWNLLCFYLYFFFSMEKLWIIFDPLQDKIEGYELSTAWYIFFHWPPKLLGNPLRMSITESFVLYKLNVVLWNNWLKKYFSENCADLSGWTKQFTSWGWWVLIGWTEIRLLLQTYQWSQNISPQLLILVTIINLFYGRDWKFQSLS